MQNEESSLPLTWALRDIERRYRILVTQSPVGIFHTDAQGRCLFVNDRWCDITGLPMNEAMGEGWVRVLYPVDRDRIFTEWKQAAEKNIPFQSEYRFQRSDGTIRWVLGQGVAERGAHGEVLGYIGAITDITAHKETDEVQREAYGRELESKAHEQFSQAAKEKEELQKENWDLWQLNRMMMDREHRILDLKQEINGLLQQLGKPPKYDFSA